jgi:hypothetical protein
MTYRPPPPPAAAPFTEWPDGITVSIDVVWADGDLDVGLGISDFEDPDAPVVDGVTFGTFGVVELEPPEAILWLTWAAAQVAESSGVDAESALRTLADSVGLRPPRAPKQLAVEVRCPGCGQRLFGDVAARGACLACFPPVPHDHPSTITPPRESDAP